MPTRFNKRTRLLSGLLTLAMLFSAAPVSAFAAMGDSEHRVYVGGNTLSGENPTLACGSGTVTYDLETDTLTLENAQVPEGSYATSISTSPNFAGDTLTIYLVGENTVTRAGIYCYGNLIVTGPGSLNITTTADGSDGISAEGDCTIRDTTITVNTENGAAINSFRTLTIENSNIEAASDMVGISAGTNSEYYPSQGEIHLTGGKIVTTSTQKNGIYTNGDLTVTDVDLESTGYWPALYAEGDIELNGGKAVVNSTGDCGIFTQSSLTVKNVNLQADGYYAALLARGDMELTGGKVNATTVDDSAIFANGNMKLSGGQVTAESPKYSAINTSGELTVEHTDLKATGGWPALYADGDITLTGGKIEAESTENWAISTNGNLSVNGGAKLHAVSQGRPAIGFGGMLNLGRAEIEVKGVGGSFFRNLADSAVIGDDYRIAHLKAGSSADSAERMEWEDASDTLHTCDYVSFSVKHNHKFSDEMGWDETYHWYKCMDPDCQSDEEDAQLGKDVHQFNDEGICMICGYASAEDSSCEGSGAAVVLVGAAVAGAAYGVYELGTRAVLRCILPEGTAIPRTKGELALLLWNEAGRPETEPVSGIADLADIADPDTAKAVQWAVDSGILTRNEDGTFHADKRISKIRVIRSWKEQHP